MLALEGVLFVGGPKGSSSLLVVHVDIHDVLHGVVIASCATCKLVLFMHVFVFNMRVLVYMTMCS